MVSQHLQVLGDGGLGDPELLSDDGDDFSRSEAVFRQDLQDASPDRITEDVEGVA